MASTGFGWPLRLGGAHGKGTQKGNGYGVSTVATAIYGPIAPAAIVTNGAAVAQAVAGAGNLTLAGSLATGGVVTFDYPRAVQILSTDVGDTTQTATVTGTDTYGVTVVETITFNGTTAVSGKKAFKTITKIAISAAMTGNASAGSTDIFGLPLRVDGRYAIRTFWDTAYVTTGTFAAAITTNPATATTGDVRGTFLVPSASDAAKKLYVLIDAADPDTNNGLYGIDQYGG